MSPDASTAPRSTGPAGRTAAPPSPSPGTLRWIPLIVLGGALGTAGRAALEGAYPPAADALPWVTLVINVVGSFLLGMLVEALSAAGSDRGWRRAVRLAVGTGVLGGFTTYSTFMVESAERIRDSHLVVAGGYLVGSVLLGLAAAGAGVATAAAVRRSPGRSLRGTAR